MNHTVAIRPAPDSSSARTLTSRFALPADLVGQARKRLGMLGLAFGCLTVLLGPTALLQDFATPAAATFMVVTIVATGIISFSIFLAARSKRLSDATVLMLGVLWEFVMCLSNGTIITWDIYERTGHLPELTFSLVIIVLFPLIVPSTPILTLLTSSVAASMAPLGLGILYWIGAIDQVSAADLISVSAGPIGCIALAYMGSSVIHNIGTELVRARALGSYTLEEMLGRGGMGEVWRAKHRMLSRPAAIKLIKPEALGEQATAQSFAKRFELEAQTTASLRSPHTIELYDFGISPDGTFYYVMELLDGIDLQELVDQHGPLPARRVVYLLCQVCHSLREAHGAGLIHRDIKPANIFVGRYGADTDFVKVLDFGLVKHSAETEADQNLTHEGRLVGTPAFLAPEMVMSETDIDARVDIYSLGCVAYWLLTGFHVFASKNVAEAIVHHVTEQPEAPSTHAEQEIPEALDAIVLSCLEKDPAKRPQSAGEFADALAAVEFDTPWAAADAEKWWDQSYPRSPAPAV